MYKISVIMSVFNETVDLLEQSIESILNQTYSDLEFVIVIDNPNNNDAIECVKRYEKRDNRVVACINESNIGLPKSLNRALTLTTGDFIARMDADDISLPMRLENEINVLIDKKLDLVASGIVRIDMNGNVIKKDTKYFNSSRINFILRYTDVLPHPTWLVRKELYDKLGGYRDFRACEDYDFLLRARNIGARMGMVPKCLLKYRSNSSGISQSNALKQTLYTNYLGKNHKKIERITVEDLYRYEQQNINARVVDEYTRHTKRMLELAQSPQISVRALCCLLVESLSCKYIFYNYEQIFLKKICACKNIHME